MANCKNIITDSLRRSMKSSGGLALRAALLATAMKHLPVGESRGDGWFEPSDGTNVGGNRAGCKQNLRRLLLLPAGASHTMTVSPCLLF